MYVESSNLIVLLRDEVTILAKLLHEHYNYRYKFLVIQHVAVVLPRYSCGEDCGTSQTHVLGYD